MFSGSYMIYMVLAGILTMIGGFVSNRLQSKFQQYAGIALRNGMSGKEVAEAMLSHYGITDVKVLPAQGFLTDHYNPMDRTVNLSEAVYASRSIGAAAVAAHECGHAVQHATAYPALKMRSAIVPMVKVASTGNQFLLPLALGMAAQIPSLLLICLAGLGITTLFSLITLPVEFDASKRALVWLNETGTTSGEEHEGAKDALWWAAMTYVAAAMSSLVTFLYVLFQYMSRRN